MSSTRLLTKLSRSSNASFRSRFTCTPSASLLRSPTKQIPLYRVLNHPPSASACTRNISTSSPLRNDVTVEPPDYLNPAEQHIFALLQQSLQPSKLEVQDISGGCGSMYGIEVVSEQFKGLSVIKQHRLVNSVLGEEIKKWHGVQLKTKAP